MVTALGARRGPTSAASPSTRSTGRPRRGCSPPPRSAPRPRSPIPCLSSRPPRSRAPPSCCSAPRGPRHCSGSVLASLGARVVKVEHPRRPDPFPLRDELVRGQVVLGLDLGVPAERDAVAGLVEHADLVVDGHPPRVFANAGHRARPARSCGSVRSSRSDRPGYGPGAEAHGGWAARHDPPRLARTSVADPVAGLVGAVAAVHLLTAGERRRARTRLARRCGRTLARAGATR